MAATKLLARGWLRGRKAGWFGTAAVLAATLLLLVLVSALFAGIQAETEERVADVFTGELRITPQEVGVFGGGTFENATATVQGLGTSATMRMEAQYVLSRRGFVEAIAGEEEQFTFFQPGTGGDRESVALGVFVGVPFSDPASAAPYRKHLVVGDLPATWDGQGAVPVVMSVGNLEGFLTPEEIDHIQSLGGAFPPPQRHFENAFGNLRFEITAAVVDESSGQRDVIRHPARLAGLYRTGVETLDAFTVWGPIEAARHLLGHDTAEDIANVLIVEGDAEAGSAAASQGGWVAEDSGSFTGRYLGQLVAALRVLSQLTASVLFTIPAFLVAHGINRVLEAHKREVAVLMAMGVPNRSFRGALARLVGMTFLSALVVAGLAAVAIGLLLHAMLPTWQGAPVPLDVLFTWTSVVGAAVVAGASVVVAFWVAVRGQRRLDLSETLRSL